MLVYTGGKLRKQTICSLVGLYANWPAMVYSDCELKGQKKYKYGLAFMRYLGGITRLIM